MDEESLSSLEDSELLSLLSESEAEESDSEEEDSEEEDEEDLFGSTSGFCATMTFGIFLRCSRNSSLIKNITTVRFCLEGTVR